MQVSRLPNDTRTPPQARILAAVLLAVGLASVLGAFKPWQNDSGPVLQQTADSTRSGLIHGMRFHL